MIGEELVTDVMEVADDRHIDALLEQLLLDVRDGGSGLVAVDGDAHDLRAGARERSNLRRGRGNVGGVRVGHRLHDDGRVAAHGDMADLHRY